MEIANVEIVDEGEIECIDSTRNPIICSKILHHFIKGKISLSPMETILVILDGIIRKLGETGKEKA
jgi:hypothetical protein